MTYASAVADASRLQREMQAASRHNDRRPAEGRLHGNLILRSDDLLHELERLNVEAYRPYRPEQPVRGGRKTVRLPADLAQTVNELLAEVGLPVRRLRTTSEALEVIWSAQRRILGQPDDVDEEGE